jgi:hypothetical protein
VEEEEEVEEEGQADQETKFLTCHTMKKQSNLLILLEHGNSDD